MADENSSSPLPDLRSLKRESQPKATESGSRHQLPFKDFELPTLNLNILGGALILGSAAILAAKSIPVPVIQQIQPAVRSANVLPPLPVGNGQHQPTPQQLPPDANFGTDIPDLTIATPAPALTPSPAVDKPTVAEIARSVAEGSSTPTPTPTPVEPTQNLDLINREWRNYWERYYQHDPVTFKQNPGQFPKPCDAAVRAFWDVYNSKP